MLLESGNPNTSTNSTNCKEADLLEDYLNVYMSLLLTVAVGGFVVCMKCHGCIICPGTITRSKQTEICYWLFGTTLFGIGAMLCFLFRLPGDITGGTSFIAGDIYNALQILFILMQLFFVLSVSDVPLKK